jgi:uncharacterized protein DUF6364
VAKTNLTIQIEAKTVLRAKALAASRGTSVSALVAKTLESMVDEHERYEAARRQAERNMAEAKDLGGRDWTRDELHDR